MEENIDPESNVDEANTEQNPNGFDSEFFRTEVRKIYEMQTQVIETLHQQKELTSSQYNEIHEITKDLRQIMVSNAAKTSEILKISNFISNDVGPAFEKLLQKFDVALSDEKILMEEILRYQKEDLRPNILEEIVSEGKTFRHLLANILKSCNGLQETANTIDQDVQIVKARTIR